VSLGEALGHLKLLRVAKFNFREYNLLLQEEYLSNFKVMIKFPRVEMEESL
jgi:hypothetical protein